MDNEPPEKRKCRKDVEYDNVTFMHVEDWQGMKADESEIREDVEDMKEREGNGDSEFLSQATGEEGGKEWTIPTQPSVQSVPDSLEEGMLKSMDEIEFRGDFNSLAEENQRLIYRISNLERSNEELHDRLTQLKRFYEMKIDQQKSIFEKAKKSMRDLILCQEHDLKTMNFRERLEKSALTTASGTGDTEIKKHEEQQCSSALLFKKVIVPKIQGGKYSPGLQKLQNSFGNSKFDFSDSFSPSKSRRKAANVLKFYQNENSVTKDINISKTSDYASQISEDELDHVRGCLHPSNLFSKLREKCDELIVRGFYCRRMHQIRARNQKRILRKLVREKITLFENTDCSSLDCDPSLFVNP